MTHKILDRIHILWRAESMLLLSAFAIASLILLFGVLADEVSEDSTLEFDRYVIMLFRTNADVGELVGPPWIQQAARDVTSLGGITVLTLLVGCVTGYLLLIRSRTSASLLLISVLGGVALNSSLKIWFARPRPDFVVPVEKVFTLSFPSGHAAISAVTYLTLAALIARTTSSKRLRIYFIIMGIVLTLLIGISRVYLGVHYPTDVLAGWCIGSLWALCSWTIADRVQRAGGYK